MHRFHYWLCAILAAPLLIVVTPATTGSADPPERPEKTPHPAEVALLEELSLWTGFSAPGVEPDPSASLSMQLELFQRPSAVRAARRLLGELPFGDQIGTVAITEGVDPLLLASIVEVESRFDAEAVSPRGALGLMQVMPATAEELGFDACDPSENLRAGASYLATLLERFEGDLRLALAAYNAGPGAVNRFDGVPPYRETTRYVERVMRRYLLHLRELWQAEGFHVPEAEDTPRFARVLGSG